MRARANFSRPRYACPPALDLALAANFAPSTTKRECTPLPITPAGIFLFSSIAVLPYVYQHIIHAWPMSTNILLIAASRIITIKMAALDVPDFVLNGFSACGRT